jgi:protein-tyrosine phosphatase
MVCLGNICRSPLAEGILRKLTEDNSINAHIDSCGTANYHVGEAPDPRSVQVAKEQGIDISHLSGRQFKTADFDAFDFILAMDENNLSDILGKAKNEGDKAKVKLMLSYLPNETDKNVFDPYYGSINDFEAVYHQLHTACSNFIETELK